MGTAFIRHRIIDTFDGVIYEPGKHYDKYTGGWKESPNVYGTLEEQSDGYYLDAMRLVTAICTQNPVSFKGYTKINFLVNSSSTQAERIRMGIAVDNTPTESTSSGFAGNYSVSATPGESNKDITVSVAINGADSGYVGVSCRSLDDYRARITVKKIWLT